jgi:hypothetical protein
MTQIVNQGINTSTEDAVRDVLKERIDRLEKRPVVPMPERPAHPASGQTVVPHDWIIRASMLADAVRSDNVPLAKLALKHWDGRAD